MSIKDTNNNLKHRTARFIMEDEIKYKQQQKQKSERDINMLSIQLKSKLNIMIFCLLPHKVKLAVKYKS